ncbi:ABC transporter permease [Comamonas sp. NoAH]|uniref:ABC transporter permease n=1 Tax=Comamonas halotolerans TaxID=3041496 RepID=UPI0024E09D0B|nr:ABC transporter permease [Comamonas sp. NoAH]
MFFNTILLALRSIRRNLLRSFLTILGIVIGVSAVITMVTLGNGATMAVQSQIQGLGTNLLQIRSGMRMGPGAAPAPSFKDTDALVIEQQIGGIAAVAPEARSSVTLVADGRNWSSTVIGSTNEWLKTGNWKLSQGREFSDEELRAGSSVCIIGSTLHRELYQNSTDVLGRQLRVKAFSCSIIGVLDSKGQGAFGNDQDDQVLIPLKTLQRRVTGNTRVSTLLVSMADDSDPERVKSSLRDLLRELRKLAPADEDNFNVLDTKQLADTMAGTTKVMTTLLGAVAAVSLLVGGIGIMNIMLVSVTERTREIGLRLAIGALEREVLLQFLIEAVVLAALGGLIGIAIAAVASVGLAQVMQVPFIFNPVVNVLSFVFSAAIGVLFGYFPARRAAQLDPIEALRHE